MRFARIVLLQTGRIRSASELRCAFVGTLTGAGDDVAGRSGKADLETSGVAGGD